MQSKANSTLNRAGARVYRFNKHHDNTVISALDRLKDDFIKNAANGTKLRKRS